MNQTRLIAGAMSGTSADGVDVALVRVGQDYSKAVLVGFHHCPYEKSLQEAIANARRGDGVLLRDLASLGRKVSLAYALAVTGAMSASGPAFEELSIVAAHGQTLFHDPPLTVQWLDPSLVAALLGCAVVSDFRRADCAAGGQGAPLVPFADFHLFRHASKGRVLLNIGGIANLTWLKAGGGIDEVIAFDTGPGNCVSDYLCRGRGPTFDGYDAGGALAATGRADEEVVSDVMREGYFLKRPAKSTDGPAMIEMFEKAVKKSGREHSLEDLLGTACLLTAVSIGCGIRDFVEGKVDELIVSGGGTCNHTMMRHLSEFLTVPVRMTDELGMPSEAKEAVAFALLGAATLDGVPGNVPSATGAKRAVVLGSLTPRPV